MAELGLPSKGREGSYTENGRPSMKSCDFPAGCTNPGSLKE